MNAARAGNMDAAARAELAISGIEHPTPLQLAGATLRCLYHHDVALIRGVFEE